MCQIQKAVFLSKKMDFYPFFRSVAQVFAQVAQPLMRNLFLLALGITSLSCTGHMRKAPREIKHADAILVSGKSLFVFDFGHNRFQKWALPDGSPSHSCQLLDTLSSDWSAPSQWLALGSPVQPFQPTQAIWGPNGHFFLLDRASKRLALYDTNAQFLSGFSLPPEIRDRNLNRMEVYWTRDGFFSFLDRDDAKVWKYAEVQSSGGSGDWQLRYTLNVPMGLEACLWEPYFKRPSCLAERTGLMLFDDYFNATTDKLNTMQIPGISVHASDQKTGWNFFFKQEKQCGSGQGYIYSPDEGGFYSLSDSNLPQPGLTPSLP